MNSEKNFDIVAIGTIAYDMILRTVDESLFTRDTTLLNDVGVSAGGAAMVHSVIGKRLGCRTAIVTKLCRDTFSEYLMGELLRAGVDVSQVAHSDTDNMSLTFALVKPDGTRHFLGLAGSNNQSLCLKDFDLSIVRQAKIVSYGSFFFLQGLDGEGARTIFTEAKNAGALVVADCASDSFHQGCGIVFDNLPLVDYFIPSYVEAAYLTGEKDPQLMARMLLRKGCRNVIIKLGQDGCFVTDGAIQRTIPTFQNVKAKDTTGAGDNFVAGFMAALVEGMQLPEAARYANAVASVSVTQMGGITALKDKSQVLQLLSEQN